MHEIIFQNSLLTLRTLNLFVAFAFFFAGIFSIRYIEKHKMSLVFLAKYFLPVLFSALLFGRLLTFALNFEKYSNFPLTLLYLWDLDFNFFGLLFGAFFILYILCKRHHEDFWAWLDVIILSSLAMLIFVHIGFFFSGHYYGLPTNLFWGIPFEANHIPYTTPIHPTQLYAALLSFVLLIQGVKKSKRTHLSGLVGSKALMLYSVGMLGISFLYGDPELPPRIFYAILIGLSFIANIHCSHKSHSTLSN